MPSSGRFRAAQCVVPTAETESGRWFGKLRRRNGAALALIFHKPRAQWPGRNRTQALLILRAGNVLPTSRGNPRNGGPGADSPCQGEMSRSDRGGRVGEYGHEVSILSRPPAILKVNCPEGAREGGLGHWFLSHRWERNSPPAGGETPLRKEPSSGPMRASGPTKKRSIIAPSSVTASPCHLPPRGKAFGGSTPSSVPFGAT